ncbi:MULTISPECIES: hypothetical protein [Bacillaceae]|uniref:Uncharacterized protein n=1 Tax=Domibacillus aminovorans TaxID=29332 RepID=A0A177KZG2_9BACI|nr:MULTISPECIES: hypothetical protein [Bacillaceae]OAH58526.1 hypothetical protein AWH48_17375 [Domibacillus aminovorans]
MNKHFEPSKLDIKVFDQKDSRPFAENVMIDKEVYELRDDTMRTPLEKAEVFEQLLQTEDACELWIIPVTESTSSFTQTLSEEKTSALFGMLSMIRERVQRDRTFLVVGPDCSKNMTSKVEQLGYTVVPCEQSELESLTVEY